MILSLLLHRSFVCRFLLIVLFFFFVTSLGATTQYHAQVGHKEALSKFIMVCLFFLFFSSLIVIFVAGIDS